VASSAPVDRLRGYDRPELARNNPMLDLILLVLGLGFFALSVAYAFACDLL